MWPNVRDCIHLSLTKIWLQNLMQQQECVTVTFHKHKSAEAGVCPVDRTSLWLKLEERQTLSNGTEKVPADLTFFLTEKKKKMRWPASSRKKREEKTINSHQSEWSFVPGTWTPDFIHILSLAQKLSSSSWECHPAPFMRSLMRYAA